MIPYIIGITGHRNIAADEVAWVEKQVRTVLARADKFSKNGTAPCSCGKDGQTSLN